MNNDCVPTECNTRCSKLVRAIVVLLIRAYSLNSVYSGNNSQTPRNAKVMNELCTADSGIIGSSRVSCTELENEARDTFGFEGFAIKCLGE